MKTIKMISQFTATAFLLGLFSVFAAAQTGPVIDASSTSSQLEMSATVQTSLQLNISTGTGGAAVSGSNAAGLFSVSLGNVNGLGNGTPASGVSKAANGDGYNYSTPINLTPVYSGFTSETASVSVEAGASGDEDIALEGGAANTMSGISGTPRSAFSGAASGSSNQRVVGFHVARGEAAGLKTATFIYTVSMGIN